MRRRVSVMGAVVVLSFGVLGMSGCGQSHAVGSSNNQASPLADSQSPGSKAVPSNASRSISSPNSSTARHRQFNPQSIDMVSPSVGWVWNQDTIWWTQDGGGHWAVETPRSLPKNSTLSVQVISKNVAWAAVSTNLMEKPPFPVWVTTTHGTQWHRTTSLPHNDGISFISPVSAGVLWMATDMVGASGSESMVLDATINGGKTWTMLPSSVTSQMATQPDVLHPKSVHPIPFFADKSGITMTSTREGFITGGQTGQTEETALLSRTADGGQNWFNVRLPNSHGEVLNWTFPPRFFSAQDGLMAVEVNNSKMATYTTHDGGTTWTSGTLLPFSRQLGSPLWSFATIDSGLYLAMTTNVQGVITGATLYGTSNGGRSWKPFAANSLPLGEVKSLDDVSTTTAFAVTRSKGQSTIWKTQNGGHTWQALNSSW